MTVAPKSTFHVLLLSLGNGRLPQPHHLIIIKIGVTELLTLRIEL
jgi:hypothetical protein